MLRDVSPFAIEALFADKYWPDELPLLALVVVGQPVTAARDDATADMSLNEASASAADFRSCKALARNAKFRAHARTFAL